MKEMLKLSLALGIIASLAAAALALAFSFTEEDIRAAKREEQAANLKKVLPEFDNNVLGDNCIYKRNGEVERGRQEIKLGKEEVWFFIARKGDDASVVGIAGWTAAKGFGGPVEVLVGLNPDGAVRKVLVVSHSETPGLGTQVTDRQRMITIFDLFGKKKNAVAAVEPIPPNEFLDQFEAFSLDGTVKIKLGTPDLMPISGATISSKAVTDAVAKLANVFAENRDEIVEAKPIGTAAE